MYDGQYNTNSNYIYNYTYLYIYIYIYDILLYINVFALSSL